ncbi:Adenosine monophosphate-protein transferase SoFic [Pontiella desulfatans]|uniref:Adenosine monophosphate-protein transferase SoFic n=1 Tax=Pontiella desulfatans TaxID=2750659 RepID=A0A6C2U6P6_PONDE|nr:Fic family protein [Pontiella desulfatans]VGO15742.1 Adenosine monophosphate-protein transferase SoFic [Pontiella desulfatans]
MKYIHQLNNWPEFQWDSERLIPLLADLRYRQGRLLGQMELQGFKLHHLQEEANLITLTSDIVQSSAIEGERLDPEQVRSSIARHLGMDIGGSPQVARHIDGIVEMMIDATTNYSKPLTEDRLFGWHAALFPTGRSGMRDITVGAWRPPEGGPMQVVSGPMGREKVHFEAPEAEKLKGEMATFLEWFNKPLEIDPVIKAAIAHFWFVTIHPFSDGNGRIARAVAELALARADESSKRYYSMSAQIESERHAYYDSLKNSQRGTLDITRWLVWFLECLGRTIDRAQGTLAGVLRKARIWEKANSVKVNDRQHQVLTRLLNGFEGHLNTSKYAKLAKCSTDTALRDIRALLDMGLIIQNPGGGRSTSYRLAEPDKPSLEH